MWKRVGSAPSGQGCLWQPNGPECAKSHAASQSPSSRTEKLRTFSKKYYFLFFDPFQGPLGRFLRFQRCRPSFVAGILFDGSGCTRKAKSNSGCCSIEGVKGNYTKDRMDEESGRATERRERTTERITGNQTEDPLSWRNSLTLIQLQGGNAANTRQNTQGEAGRTSMKGG